MCVRRGWREGEWGMWWRAEIWRYQYLTYPSSIFMADNRADMQLSHMSASVFITGGNRACK